MGTSNIRATARQSSHINSQTVFGHKYQADLLRYLLWQKVEGFQHQRFWALSITVNKKGLVVLKYWGIKSKISVQYDDQESGLRILCTWILFPFCEKGVTIKVAEQLKFRAIVPRKTSPVLALMETQKPTLVSTMKPKRGTRAPLAPLNLRLLRWKSRGCL